MNDKLVAEAGEYLEHLMRHHMKPLTAYENTTIGPPPELAEICRREYLTDPVRAAILENLGIITTIAPKKIVVPTPPTDKGED